MPWAKHHKDRTRARIIAAAAAALRAHGINDVSVSGVMADAGLTHGGFYAHFASKDELLREAFAVASSQSLEPLVSSAENLPPDERLRAVVDAYLSSWHLTHPAEGCPVAAVGAEAARAGGDLAGGVRAAIRERIEWMRGLLPGGRGRRRHDDAAGALACMVGGLVLARALGGEEGASLLESCRRFLHRAQADGGAA
jgi:TetR/AcrR family transcriptional repressor of nem operon